MAINCHFGVVDGWEKVYNRYFGCRIWFCTQKYPPTRRLGSYAVNLRKWPKSQKCQKLLYLANLMCLMPGKVYITIIWDAEFDFARRNTLRGVDWGLMLKICENGQNPANVNKCHPYWASSDWVFLRIQVTFTWEWARTQYMRCAQASWVRA